MAGYPHNNPVGYGYGAPPAQPYGAAPYGGAPAQPYGAPQPHGQAPYGAPAQPYGAPSAPYGAPHGGEKPPKEHKPSAAAPYGAAPPYGAAAGGYPPAAPYGSPFASLVPSAFPPGTDPSVVTCFQMADQDGSGFIDDKELQRALSSYNQSFSLRTVHLLMYNFTNSNVRKIGKTFSL